MRNGDLFSNKQIASSNELWLEFYQKGQNTAFHCFTYEQRLAILNKIDQK